MNEIAELFHRLTSGVYVVNVAHTERLDAFTAAWVMQASFDPLLLAVSINPRNASYPSLQASGTFAVNVLKQGQLELARYFGTRSGREHDKLASVSWRPACNGAPVLQEALAYFECELTEHVRVGDHSLVVGRVTGGQILDFSATPMHYTETGAMDGSSKLFPASF